MRRALPIVLIALAAAAPAQAATPDEKIANQVFTDYTKDGRIDPCDYTTAELQTALDNVQPNERQYASDYPAAIKQAIRFRARGGCDEDAAAPAPTTAPAAPAPSTSATTVTPPVAGTTTLPPRHRARRATRAGHRRFRPPAAPPADTAVERAAAAAPANDTPAPLVGLGLLAVLLALTAALLLTVRRLGQRRGPPRPGLPLLARGPLARRRRVGGLPRLAIARPLAGAASGSPACGRARTRAARHRGRRAR